MNSRRTILLLGVLIAVLLVINGITIAVLLRQRAEIEFMREHIVAQDKKMARERGRNTRERAINEPLATSITATQTLSIVLGETNQEDGLQQVYDTADGATVPAVMEGVACRELTGSGGRQKIYFKVDASFKQQNPMNVRVQVEYFDAGPAGMLSVEYVGPRAYTAAEPTVALRSSRAWHTAEFVLKDAQFTGRQNAGGDLRVVVTTRKTFVRRVTLKME